MIATVNAEEAQLFCSSACEISFERRKVRWGYLTAVFPYLKEDSREKGSRCLSEVCSNKGQHMQAKPGRILINVRDTTVISVLALD